MKKQQLLKEFARLFGNIGYVLSIKITGIDYNQAELKDGKIPFQANFQLPADPDKYQQKAERMIEILTQEMGGSLISGQPVKYQPQNGSAFENYIAEVSDQLNELTYATVVVRNGYCMPEIYRIGGEYTPFFQSGVQRSAGDRQPLSYSAVFKA